MIHEAVATYTYDRTLGADLQVIVSIKGFNQLAIVQKIIERKGQKSFGLTANENASTRRYSTGKLLLTDLDRAGFDETLLTDAPSIDCLEPYHVAIQGQQMAYTAGPQFTLIDLQSGQTRTFTNEWMAYLHTVDFAADGRHVLTVSTGFDTIQEIDLHTKQRGWEWNAWDQGFTYCSRIQAHFVRNQRQAAHLRQCDPHARVTVIDDPALLPREGLSTQETPLNLNGVFYGPQGQLLATAYHRPELFVIERSGAYQLVDLGLCHPHSFLPLTVPGGSAYMVANTGAGQLLFLDESLVVERIIDLSTLPASESKKRGFGEWLQTVSILDAQRGYFAVVDALRDGIHLLDIPNQRRRFMATPPHWTIQTLTPVPAPLVTSIAQAMATAQGCNPVTAMRPPRIGLIGEIPYQEAMLAQ